MNVYLVGGAVRDMVMGYPSHDYDFVVVGATPEDFKDWSCVGNDFPVFLEPTHGWEVTLARVERKVGVGYTGFETDWDGVTLEQDLMRRDLTINSLAIEVDFEASVKAGIPIIIGSVHDYFNGVEDILSGCLRHVSDSFSEDPVRVLRLARFLAKYSKYDWVVDEGTSILCYQMFVNGDLEDLVPERVWLETEKALNTTKPSVYFDWLTITNIFEEETDGMVMTDQREDYHPEKNLWTHVEMVMDYAAKTWNDPEITLACYLHDLGKIPCWKERGNAYGHEKEGLPLVESFCSKWKIPNRYKNLAMIVCEYHTKVHLSIGCDTNSWMLPKTIMKMFDSTGALRNQERFLKLLKACEADNKGRGSTIEQIEEYIAADYHQRQYLTECLQAVVSFDTSPFSKKLLSEGKSGVAIGQLIREQRIHLIRQVQKKWKAKLSV